VEAFKSWRHVHAGLDVTMVLLDQIDRLRQVDEGGLSVQVRVEILISLSSDLSCQFRQRTATQAYESKLVRAGT
jgi:hypothetical protein